MSHAIPAASGGFVSRSERSPPRAHGSTQPVVGPGSYDPVPARSLQPDVGPAPVPFHTSAERVLAANNTTSAITPGPGAYDGAARAAAGGGIAAGPNLGVASPFVSGVPRLPASGEERTRREVPGPGSYDAANAWVKGGLRYDPSRGRGNAAAAGSPAAARVAALPLNRRPTAPSVPGRGQSYGYEEATDGSLVLQPPPEKAYTGVGRDTVGPGSYEPAASPSAAASPSRRGAAVPGTGWAASKSDRSPKFGSAAPGPGSYNLADSGPRRPGAGLLVTIGGVEVVFGGGQGTSSFVSRALRPLQKAPEASPGPGDYDTLHVAGAGTGTGGAGPVGVGMGGNVAAPAFGSSSLRGGWEADPLLTRSAPSFWRNPGPGAYEDPRVRPGGGKQVAGSTAGAPAAAAAASPHRAAVLGAPRAPCAPFVSTSVRFGSADNAKPGPGEYHPDAVTSLEYDTYKRVTGSRPPGGFGGGGGRFPYSAGPGSPARGALGAVELGLGIGGGAGTPGPGNYDPKVDPAKPAARSGHSVFASRVGRFRPVTAPPAVPDLSEYDGGGELRGDPSRLGPGRYSPEKPAARPAYSHVAGRVAPFGTDSRRTKVELPTAALTPGPGRYDGPAAAKDPSLFRPLSLPPSKAAFACQTDRFAPAPGQGGSRYTPGPGAYVGPDSGIVRRSFNITFGGPVPAS